MHEHGSEHHAWFYQALARKVLPSQPESVRALGEDAWVERLDGPGRVVIELVPQKWISFDGRKVGEHAEGRWEPGDPWVEPDED